MIKTALFLYASLAILVFAVAASAFANAIHSSFIFEPFMAMGVILAIMSFFSLDDFDFSKK